jgi:hypothetical protein
MSKKREVGEDFSQNFSSVGFYTRIDYGRNHDLGQVAWADGKHNGVILPRIPRQTGGVQVMNICFARLHQETASLGQSLHLAMNHGLKPALFSEMACFFEQVTDDEMDKLFKYADSICVGRRIACAVKAAIPCLGSMVVGGDGGLIPVYVVDRIAKRRTSIHLKQVDFDRAVPPAQLIPFVR